MLLAVDTSTSRAGIALYDGDVIAETTWLAGRDHGRHLMPVIQETLQRLGRQPTDLTAVAAARGPGSFTGLRVGLAVAQGLRVALGIPLYGVGSLEVLAHGLPPMGRAVRAVLAAGRGRFATARFQEDGLGGYIQADKVMGVDLATLLRLADEQCMIVGDLDSEARQQLAAPGVGATVASPALCVRRPGVLAELAWQRFQAGDPPGADAGEPIYLARE
ncbi:MAG: tRNA (adenosine(37)-N6)-threonylcarbamoyltransferase complex dimerization subunit type 1 TsaB [Chloroflexota bacterium]